ncbi:phosphoglucosamine mutase [Actinomycetaceae bacterium WB03_NA08]|uniref:Phosphoglucosamine mutase n=1 Tax=Scrofimicrobium canadense TaxID=2652290 RepID=A0A6N7W6J5_9ACTO|nr:phosphoglucosamine mutase [Scrofimicrobium canadense]MSS83778.1 phosphoglucosamine mutase [Scrofimicrobium canadense]
MARLFGTDGVRGLANRDITADLALRLGEAAARGIGGGPREDGSKPRAVIGRDTRISGEFLDHAIAAGLAAAGVDAVRIGVVTTPTVAHLTATEPEIDLGVMISASHNPMPDNGIKFFGRGGYKLDDAVEDHIEALLDQPWDRPTGAAVGEVWYDDDMAEKSYVEHLVESTDADLRGLRIAVDCANGAASHLGPEALREAGADVVVINASPDGRNINDACGSTHPEQLQAAVVASKADFGVAYDGDADRCLAVDANGNLVDGDKIMGALAIDMKARGQLAQDTLVVTVMSNLGLKLAMEAHGIAVVQTAVGDRYVLEAMREGGYSLGGEQSGHIIALDYSTTGDGILSSMLISRMVKNSGKTLAELVAPINRLPQTLINVSGVDRGGLENEAVQQAVTHAEGLLGERGRVLLRASGTEPLIRVMVEASTQQEADGVAAALADVVEKNLAF